MHAFVVLGSSQEIGFGNVPEMTYFVSSGAQNLNSYQSTLAILA